MTGKSINLMDIADDLLIINKKTIDTLIELDNAADCIALYVFYYKTAKWQKTNRVKATDVYVMKCLKFGRQRLANAKNTLIESGLVKPIQARKQDGTIDGWYIEVSYLVTSKYIGSIQMSENQHVDKSTSGELTPSALKQNNKCLKTEEEVLKEFEVLWELYPNKKGKRDALRHYRKAREEGVTFEEVKQGIEAYSKYIRETKSEKYTKYGSSFFNQWSWQDNWSKDFEESEPQKKSQEEMESEMNFLEKLRRKEAEERRIEREMAEWKALEDEYGSNQHQ